MSVLYLYDPLFLQHDTGPGHPERAERLVAIERRLRSDGLWDRLEHRRPRAASSADLELVHPRAHVERIASVATPEGGAIDADTVVGGLSFEAARCAVGAGLDAVDAVVRGDAASAFCAVRPPGHHAESSRAMGFCLFNNVAVAARHAQREHGLERVAIVDWDVHHGNGTQEIFERDPSVLYASIHQHPLYPGTGMAGERGIGEGEGFTLNIPMPAGCGDAEYRSAFEIIGERLVGFNPQLLLISAGFDAHERDPLASMRVTTAGFRWMMEWALAQADALCDGRMVAMLEGGYDLEGLSSSVAACISVMLEH